MMGIKELINSTTSILSVVHSCRGINFETELNPGTIAARTPDRLYMAKVEFPDRSRTFFGASRDEVTELAIKAIYWFKANEKARSSHEDFDNLRTWKRG